MSGATVGRMVVFGTGRIARVEERSLDAIIRIWINAIGGLGRRVQLQVPRAPFLNVGETLSLVERYGKRRV